MLHPPAEINENDKNKAVLKAEYDAFMKYLLDNKVFEACNGEIKKNGSLSFNNFSQIYCQSKLGEEFKKEFLKGRSNGSFRLRSGTTLSSFQYRERYNNLYLIGFFLNYYSRLLPVYTDFAAENCVFTYQYHQSAGSREIERQNLQLAQNTDLDQLMKQFRTTTEFSKAQSKGTTIAQAVEITLKSIIKMQPLLEDDSIVAIDEDLIISQPSKLTVSSHSSRTVQQNQRPNAIRKRKASMLEMQNLDSDSSNAEDIPRTHITEKSSRVAARIAAGNIRDYFLDEEQIDNSFQHEAVGDEEVWAFVDSPQEDGITMIHEDSNSSFVTDLPDSSELNNNDSVVRSPIIEQAPSVGPKKRRRIMLDSEDTDSEEKEDSHSEKEETQSKTKITLPSIGTFFQFPPALQANRVPIQGNNEQAQNYQKSFDLNDHHILETLKEGNLKYFKWCVKHLTLSDPKAIFFEIKEKKLLLEQKLSDLIATTKKYKLECQKTGGNPTSLDQNLEDNLIYNASTFFYKNSNAKNEISAQLEKYEKAITLMGQIYPNLAETTFNNNG